MAQVIIDKNTRFIREADEKLEGLTGTRENQIFRKVA